MILIPTILCGGAGSRLWPVSRETHPKPFIRLADGQSLLQKAFLRGATLANATEVITVTNQELFFKTEDEYRDINPAKLPKSYILEPFGRNTAPAIAAAAIQVARTHGAEAILLVLPADHLIADQAAFATAVRHAVELAQGGRLVTFGIKPDRPETAYGYIQADGNRVVRFVEKPSLEKAKAYVESGDYLWNSGMFCFSAGSMLRELKRFSPEVLAATQACIEQSRVVGHATEGPALGMSLEQLELNADAFAKVPDISIDYAVMEKSTDVAVVPCQIGWSDIGSWDALAELSTPDADGNRIHGDALLHDSTGCYVQSENRLVGAVGVNDLIIIDTADALLVADRGRAQEVKHIYAGLKARGHDSYKLHRTVHRPWGTYTVVEEGAGFKIKRIVVNPHASLSLQMHQHRSEHWIVVDGRAKVVNGATEFFLDKNQSTYIPAGNKHRLENPDAIDLVIIEVQSGDYLGEDDIVRFQDDFGRVAPAPGSDRLAPVITRR
jgi:mannose-1-phosphate guanylyltransferase